jgi:demethylspheroidene O-methyltransferase
MTPSPLQEPVQLDHDAMPAHHWTDRWYALRDRLVASRRFQRWAAAFPFTRPVAQRRARALFDIVAGFVYSQVLLACVRLRLFEHLAHGPRTLPDLARALGLSDDSAQRLLAAAVSLNLIERRPMNRYGLGMLGAPMAGDKAISAMIEHHVTLYGDLADPVRLLKEDGKGAALAGYWPYADSNAAARPALLSPERVAGYSALMSASQPMISDEVLSAYSFARHRCLLDVGGGDGTFLMAVANQAPHLNLMLFDLPAVAERAKAKLGAQGLNSRSAVHGGSFFDDELPRGADVVSLIRVLFDHSDERVLCLLRNVRRALPDDGTLILAEPMSATPGAEAMGDAYFGFYLLAMGRGRPRTPDEIGGLMRKAGFDRIRALRSLMPLQTRVLLARCSATPNKHDSSPSKV